MDRFSKILVAASSGHLEPLTLRTAGDLAEATHAHLTALDCRETRWCMWRSYAPYRFRRAD